MILAHSELEAMYAYLGMVLQGEMIQALFTGLKPLVFLLLIIGVVWGIGSMMIRGRAQTVLLYLILSVASLVLLKQTMVADTQALITGSPVRQSLRLAPAQESIRSFSQSLEPSMQSCRA